MNTNLTGILILVTAYSVWGLFPIYFTLVASVPPWEILSNRIVWSFLILGAVLLYLKKNALTHLRSKKTMTYLFFASFFIASNWLIFIYGVQAEKILETSLGYYLSPLISIALGLVFFKEKMRPLQWLCLFLASCAIVYQWMSLGYFPMISFFLALSFSFYSLMKKKIQIDSLSSLFVETLFLAPFAFLYLAYLHEENTLVFAQSGDIYMSILLFASGVLTITPLLLFSKGLAYVPMYVSGFLQYITPSISFAVGVFLYGEILDTTKIITFSVIWTALVLFIIDASLHHKKNKKQQAVFQP